MNPEMEYVEYQETDEDEIDPDPQGISDECPPAGYLVQKHKKKKKRYRPSPRRSRRPGESGHQYGNTHLVHVNLVLTAGQVDICLRFGKTAAKGIMALIAEKDNRGTGKPLGPNLTEQEINDNIESWNKLQDEKARRRSFQTVIRDAKKAAARTKKIQKELLTQNGGGAVK